MSLLDKFKFVPASDPMIEDDQYVLIADEAYHVQSHPANLYFCASHLKEGGGGSFKRVLFRDLGEFKSLNAALKKCVESWESENGKK